MAVALKVRICDLIPELFAHTFIFFLLLAAAGAVTSGTLEAFLDRLYDLLVGIESYLHRLISFFAENIELQLG